MPVGRELALAREAAQRLLLPYALVTADVALDGGREHEEAAVQPRAVPARLLLEVAHARTGDLHGPESSGGLHGGDRGERTLRAVVFDQRADVDVGETVAVGETEVLLAQGGSP